MQDAFIAVVCTELYQGTLPISDGVAVALPMSAQLLMMAIASAFAGRMAEKLGTKRTLLTGMMIELAGFVTCFVLRSYDGLLIGKMLIGTGMGIVYVCCNTAAAMAKTVEKSGEAYAGVTSGILSGITIGGGLSSVLLSLGGWKLIYAVGILIVLIGLLVCVGTDDLRPGKQSEEKKKISLGKFFLNRRVLPYFLLILVPFMIALSYREYFFPLYVMDHGMDEVKVGQLFLICGLLVIYVGPYISSWVIKKFGTFWSIVFATSIMGLNLFISGIFLSVLTVIAGVVVLSLVVSFAYTCLYTYFEQLPDSLMYGDGKAMGVYSVFENLGQTVGPMVYGSLMLLGQSKGMIIFGVVVLILLICYIIAMRKEERFFH